MKRRLLTYASLLLALLAGTPPVAAQEFKPKAVIHINRIDTSKYPRVRFFFAELDSAGELVERSSGKHYRLVVDSLSKGSFKTIKKFTETSETMALVLVLQTGGSMSETLPETKKACKRLIKSFGSSVKVGLVTYTADATSIKIGSPTQAIKELEKVSFEDIMTVKMEEGIQDALELFDAEKLPAHKVMVVVSDGLTADLKEAAFTDLGKRAAESNIVVHSIGFAPLEPLRLRTLYELSKAGNGSFRSFSDPNKLASTFLKLQNEMTNQVVASWKLPDVFDGDEHDFEIRVSGGTLSDQETVLVPKPLKPEKDGGATPAGDGVKPSPLDEDEGPSTLLILGIIFGGVILITVVILVFMKIWLSGGKPKPPPDEPVLRSRPPTADPWGQGPTEDPGGGPVSNAPENDPFLSTGGDEPEDTGYRGPAGPVGPIGTDQPISSGPRDDVPQGPPPMRQMGPVGGDRGPVGGMAPVSGSMSQPQEMSSSSASSWDSPGPVSAPEEPSSLPPAGPRPVGGYSTPDPPAEDHTASQNVFAKPVMQPEPGDMSPRGTVPIDQPPQELDTGQPGMIQLPGPMDLGSLPPPEAGTSGGSQQVGSSVPLLNLPPVRSYERPDFAKAGEGIQVSNQPNLEILPAVGVAAPVEEKAKADGAGGGGWDARQTVIFSMSELEQNDLVAWIVPLDDPSHPTLSIHDEFVLGSDPSCNHVVKGSGVEPRHAILDLDPQGYWLRWAAHERATDSQLLQDGDRFRVGDRNFLFKFAIAFTDLPKGPSRLEILDGTDKGKTVPLQENVTLAVGSHPSCAVVIRGEGMGHRHALAIRQDDTCYFEDLGTEGGVSFDGALVGSKGLKPGQEIVLGRVRILFVHEE